MCRVVDVRQAVLASNDALAAGLRRELDGRGITAVNLLSSPGSGKTALLELLLARAAGRGVPAAALTADLATENDARRLARSGAPVKQVLTGGLCHLEAAQMRGHLEGWPPEGTRVLLVENVGNLVCPAAYDLGERLRVVLMSVTEGEDKPVKYPTAFGLANLVVLSKTDLGEAAGFDGDAFAESVERVNPGVEVLHTSARTGQGVDALLDRVLAVCEGARPHRPPLAGRHLREHRHEHGHEQGREDVHENPREHPRDHEHPHAHPGGPGALPGAGLSAR
ncbi:hydrogenase nickel incorporation protein HypB [Streptomyces chitinivorans]|uniref:Hydrogenase nickel incorporation protein HypB n=1 Tax=Streptomyces chitinivorans TaxID=1257027 RepID=A0ABW7HWV2_9ACTN|nr:hydrogenase nickel incorporation protein HypB [Streptomyces chitinivorans]MDH2409385.1 hydrogenase nickel incorporation protein HypB [Streptomyces chitinivorans]